MSQEPRTGVRNRPTILMFSGGRDSTLAALRLSHAGSPLVLVTATSPHLVGLPRVAERIREIRTAVPPGSCWVQVATAGTGQGALRGAAEKTCLPCQLEYCVIGARCALEVGTDTLALGYAGYQSSWPEQTPYATEALTRVLADFGIKLLFPVYSLASKHEAELELAAAGVSTSSLEQKCLRQIANVPLSGDALRAAIDAWTTALRTQLQMSSSRPTVLAREVLS